MPHLVADLLREPALPAERELALARAARAGDVVARQELVRASLRLVAMRARAMGFDADELDDALQEGVIALMAAIDRFDPERGVRLATFAWPRISGALTRWRTGQRPIPAADISSLTEPVDQPGEPRQIGEMLSLLDALPADESVALRTRLGLLGIEGSASWEQVGQRLGISPSTARRRGERAMSRLRRMVGRVCARAPLEGVDPP